jgi:DNA polymerase-1
MLAAMARERVVLIDASSMIYRAFFALPVDFRTSHGLPTNASYGFALMFRKILQGRKPALGAAVFDAPGPTFRDREFPEYKAHRPKMQSELRQQLPWIRKIVEAHDFPILRVEGVEADDVIGTLTKQARALGHEVHIISADKDFCQLIEDDVRMIDTMREVTYDPTLVRKKFGVPPEQIVDLFSLIGDKVDNVPGVPGIGQKGAEKLLAAFGDLDGVLAALDDPDRHPDAPKLLKGRVRKALEEHRGLAELSHRLVTIDTAAEIPLRIEDLTIPAPDLERIDALYQELEFRSLLSGEGAKEAAKVEAELGAVSSIDGLRTLLEGFGRRPVALVPVHERPNPVQGALVGLAFAASADAAAYVPLRRGEGHLGEAADAVLGPWLADPKLPKIVHDARDLTTLLARHGLTLRGVTFDPQVASFLVDPTKIIPHRLDQVVREYLHRTLLEDKNLVGSGKREKPFADVPLEQLAEFAGARAVALAELAPKVAAALDDAGQRENHDAVELPLAGVLAAMQTAGIGADARVLERLGVEFAARKEELEQQIHERAGRAFNIGSGKQLQEVLYEELGLPVLKRTKTGYSTDAETLEKLSAEHPIAADVLRWRALAKLINTYTRVLREAIEPDGRIHCTIQQATAASGRLITTDPDLQRTPIRTEDGARIREAFVPREGWVLVSADWSQIELRVLAHVSKDPLLVESFREGADVHRRTAAEIFDVAPEDVDASQRNVGKTVNFATIYGQGATALSQRLGIPRREAKATIDRYFERYAGVRRWLDETIADAYRLGYVETILGRRRYIPELSSRTAALRGAGERMAANTPIQGSAADLCKLAMLRLAEDLEGRRATMLLQIHDELLFEVPPDELEETVTLVRAAMEQAYPLDVPLVVDVGHGASWAEAKA